MKTIKSKFSFLHLWIAFRLKTKRESRCSNMAYFQAHRLVINPHKQLIIIEKTLINNCKGSKTSYSHEKNISNTKIEDTIYIFIHVWKSTQRLIFSIQSIPQKSLNSSLTNKKSNLPHPQAAGRKKKEEEPLLFQSFRHKWLHEIIIRFYNRILKNLFTYAFHFPHYSFFIT